jgi:pimeloyl-ACP methyl ester carboxylesterase
MLGYSRICIGSLPLFACLFAAFLGLCGCTHWPRATVVPIPTTRSAAYGARSDTLVVFLPGRGDAMEDFSRRGLSDEMQRVGVRADWVAVDAHLGYYRARSIVERLKVDVIIPARAQGYRRIVVVGVSLGGLGGLLCERNIPGLIDGLVLLAPYLGDDEKLFASIAAAGGASTWAAGREQREPTDAELAEQLWIFIRRNHARLPATWLAYGAGDRLAGGHRLFAPLLPTERVRVIEGGHDWETWRTLWRELCVNSDLFASEKRAAQGVASDSIILK